jgi:hypothetical protein
MINVHYICSHIIISQNLSMENKRRERFEKVASNRVQKVLDYIQLLGNCANRNNYEYTEKDVELMFKEMNKALKEARIIFDKEINKTNKSGFKFK